jgi:hypothetical protein
MIIFFTINVDYLWGGDEKESLLFVRIVWNMQRRRVGINLKQVVHKDTAVL